MIIREELVEQLLDIYYKGEWWHKTFLPPEEARKYFTHLLDKGNIIIYEINGKILGYVEFWRINYEQFGRIICGEEFSAYLEEVTNNGPICYLSNIWINPDFRNGSVLKLLRGMFFFANQNMDYFVGQSKTKKSEPIKVLRRPEFMSKYLQ